MSRKFAIKWGGKSADGQYLNGFGTLRVGALMLAIIPTARLSFCAEWVGNCLLIRWGPLVLTWWEGSYNVS